MNRVRCIIFDWAGTTVDYGCFAPLSSFVEAFKMEGIEITLEEAREPMGIKKSDHIKAIFNMPRVNTLFREIKGHPPGPDDEEVIYNHFEDMLMKVLPGYTEIIPGVKELMEFLRQNNIKTGSTTGYTGPMMEIVSKNAKANGYAPDYTVNSSDVPAGRPMPYMIWKNLIELQEPDPGTVIKVGDTVVDIHEGINAGVWAVGVIQGSSELGMLPGEVASMDSHTLKMKMNAVRSKFLKAGAHYVIDKINDLPEVIDILDGLPARRFVR